MPTMLSVVMRVTDLSISVNAYHATALALQVSMAMLPNARNQFSLDAQRRALPPGCTGRGGNLGTQGLAPACPRRSFHSARHRAHANRSGPMLTRPKRRCPRLRATSTLQAVNRLEAAIRLDHGEKNLVHALVVVSGHRTA